MRSGDPEPNDKYRPWLETHVGKQGVAWDWKLCFTDIDSLEIQFAKEEYKILFELTWR